MCKKCEGMQVETKKLMAVVKQFRHVPTTREVSYMIDQCFCSCGWESTRYWDGTEYAFDEWIKHAKKIIESTQLS